MLSSSADWTIENQCGIAYLEILTILLSTCLSECSCGFPRKFPENITLSDAYSNSSNLAIECGSLSQQVSSSADRRIMNRCGIAYLEILTILLP